MPPKTSTRNTPDEVGRLATPKRLLSPEDALTQMRSLGVRTKDEVVRMIREDRDR
jgi:hypothetical protein